MTSNRPSIHQIDFRLLDHLSSHGRNLPSNLATDVDSTPQYVRERLKDLRDKGWVENVGPRNRGLYQITDDGRDALRHRNLWVNGSRDEFLDRVSVEGLDDACQRADDAE